MDERLQALRSDMVLPLRIAIICGSVIGAHVLVRLLRRLIKKFVLKESSSSHPKARTIAGLATSIAIFSLYFGAFGLILNEFGLSLKAYIASASILGLAIGFGSQGLVQDVVTGLTLVFSDLMDIDDVVEISGQTGIIRRIGMRFTILENSMGAEVFIPNRSISSIINYPRGYIRAIIDVVLPQDPETADKTENKVRSIMSSALERFPGISLMPPSIEGRLRMSSGRELLRVKFRIWPGRGGPLEASIRPELIQELKAIDGSYADWMVTVNYEVEKKSTSLSRK